MTPRLWRAGLGPLVAAFVALAAGCQTFKLSDKLTGALPWSDSAKVKEPKGPEPDRMVAVWTDTTYYHPGKPTMRGFGGRIYFYDVQGESMAVDGQLIVYAYDDTDPQKQNRHAKTPDRKYVFTPEQFKRFQSSSPLGVSYSIWIPWDPQGGPTTSVTLLPVLTSSSGKIVQGAQTLNVLPGPDGESNEQSSGFSGPFGGGLEKVSLDEVRPLRPKTPDDQGSIQQTTAESSSAPQRMRTMTLNVPPTMQQRIAGGAAGPSPAAPMTENAPPPTSSNGAPLTPLQQKAVAYFAAQERQQAQSSQRFGYGGGNQGTGYPQQRQTFSVQTATGQAPSGAGPSGTAHSGPAGETSTSGPSRSAGNSKPPQAHYGWPRRRAPGESIAPPERGHVPWRPYQ